MRSPRYYVSCIYITNDCSRFGKLDEKLMTFNELEYLLKILSPSNCSQWLNNVGMLARQGFMNLQIKDVGLTKMIKIRRS